MQRQFPNYCFASQVLMCDKHKENALCEALGVGCILQREGWRMPPQLVNSALESSYRASPQFVFNEGGTPLALEFSSLTGNEWPY